MGCVTRCDAQRGLDGLPLAQVRWTSAAASLRAALPAVPATSLLSAAAVAYLGPFTLPYRWEDAVCVVCVYV
jgi:dynein heavy chain